MPNVTNQAKTPLIVFTLSIAPETETLAPKDIKRDPRKQPSYCLNFKSLTNSTCTDEKKMIIPEFYIQGIEISDRCKTEQTDNETGDPNSDELKELQCTCHNDNTIDGYMLNLDGYEMDTFGHLPGDSRTPTPSRSMMNGVRCRYRRAPSPATEQVIRITMNKK